MIFQAAVPPLHTDDETLRRHLVDAEIPALLMTLAHLTGDPSLLPERGHGNGWLLRPQGGMTESMQEEVRELAVRVLRRADRLTTAPPHPDLLRRIIAWTLGSDTAELVPMVADEIVQPGTDPGKPAWTLPETTAGFRVAVVGAGMSGLLAAHRLSQAGVPVVIYEKNFDVGGTWHENTYPGCRVDVASHLYGYSFANRSSWPDYFCTQEVMQSYFREFATAFGLYEYIRFGAEVVSAAWDERSACWRLTVRTTEGEHHDECSVLVSAVGQLNRPSLPDITGREDFDGLAFHSARWPRDLDLAGKQVAVIGTGASAYQFIPEIAPEAGKLTVFQRTPPWLRPTPHYHEPVPVGAHWLAANVPFYAQWHRFWLWAPGLRGVLEGWVVDPDYPPTELAVSESNDALRVTLTGWMESQLTDAPGLRDKVIPSYPVGAKRVFRDNGVWFRTIKRDDVTLVTEPIESISPGGVHTADGVFHEADVLIYGTGFQASRFLAPMTVTGRGGRTLEQVWDGDARAYLGMTVPGFPNLFCLYGPNTNLSGQGGSIFQFSEYAVSYLLDAIRKLVDGGYRSLDVESKVYDEYNAWVDKGNSERAWGFSKVSSWFINEKGRTAQNWPFTAYEYWRRTRRVNSADYHFS
ncbi:NAD(P)/FAD-dependent oxidoreductase [Nocardia sp. CC227C]|uniref:flavin-containing monooxygenase n=1 Tax=Nocardia sp. CC227C TaxID=3044562 RepID=UPI00278C8D12|nr:NAD(P)/FAD-dependent oxidoreductase [Nocardia sp. CC227C]